MYYNLQWRKMEKYLIWFYPLFIFLQFGVGFSSSPHHFCHHSQALALLNFKKMFNISDYASLGCENSFQKTMSWNETEDCCTWSGVTCHDVTGYVIGLDLSCSMLDGILTPNSSLFQLYQLEKLNLAHNNFNYSPINGGFGLLTRLTHLNLSTSNFYGPVAPELSHLSNLVSLDLSDPKFYGNVLERGVFQALLQNLTKIQVLSLSFVDISSEVPTNFSSSLTYLDLGHTRLQGKLPDHIFYLPKLQILILNQNWDLKGSLPKFNCSITSHFLQVLDLSGTALSGRIPDTIGCLKSLNSLTITNSFVSGFLPESIGNLSQLRQLGLSYNNLSGPIPSSISNLLQLGDLFLSFNSLEGQIPDIFSNLQKLTNLALDNNKLAGQFPLSISNLMVLEVLNLEDNFLTGPLPSNASGLQNLTRLILSNNSFNSTIPSWLFGLQSLWDLKLENNQFTGEIEEFKGRSLQFVYLSNNQLRGPIPKSISLQPNLTILDVSSNNLHGFVEADMFLNHYFLQALLLSNNRLTWSTKNNVNISLPNLWRLGLSSCEVREFPYYLNDSTMLFFLDLSWNKIRGHLTSMPWESLFYLNISHNYLSGLDPQPWNRLEVLDLQFNQLQGLLPISICNSEVLYILNLSNNKFSGSIPQCFGNFSSQLSVLNLEKNGLQGKIGMEFATDNSLTNLGLNGNLLEGPLPLSLANCKYLEVLDLGNNKINDKFPMWAENLTELQVLVLKSNKFFGPISSSRANHSFPKLRIFDLSNNEFNGTVPAELLRNFRAMMGFDKSQVEAKYMATFDNMTGYFYQDSISIVVKGMEIEYTKILTTLTTIDLSRNRFTGEIPRVIGNLISLKVLNLSHNEFSSQIPSSLGNLSSLESLDLSYNQIQGQIPQELVNLTSLAFLNLSQNHLVGLIPQGKQFNTFRNDSYSGNLGLCGSPLTKSCGENEVPDSPPGQVDEQEKGSDFLKGFTWKSVLIGYGCGVVLGLVIGNLMFLTRKPAWLVRTIETEIYLLCRQRIASRRWKTTKKKGHKSHGGTNR